VDSDVSEPSPAVARLACISALAIGVTVVAAVVQQQQSGAVSTLSLGTLRRIATVDERYQSYNVEMAEVPGRLRDRFQPGRPIWITETADAACGGNPRAAEILDTFRYLGQLGRLAKRSVSVIFHNTLASSDYGLLDQNTFAPRPNYWAALLWHRLMGRTVLDIGPILPGFHGHVCGRSRGGKR
jgi:hypothetical protein